VSDFPQTAKRTNRRKKMEHGNLTDPNIEGAVKKLLMPGQRVEAITFVLNSLKIGLKNSKDLVDRIEESGKNLEQLNEN
jgi:ribosomal protein L7/L12